MCLLALSFLLITALGLIWLALGLGAKNDVQAKDIIDLQIRLQKCKDQRGMEAIAEKAGAWRRDRRQGDNPSSYEVSSNDES